LRDRPRAEAARGMGIKRGDREVKNPCRAAPFLSLGEIGGEI